jgi:hypothetical protein
MDLSSLVLESSGGFHFRNGTSKWIAEKRFYNHGNVSPTSFEMTTGVTSIATGR